jgi:hypothetical protein
MVVPIMKARIRIDRIDLPPSAMVAGIFSSAPGVAIDLDQAGETSQGLERGPG